MLNAREFFNSRPDGFSVLEITSDCPDRRFVPLKRTNLVGTVAGPLASLTLSQTFALADAADAVVEALYRFPLPGDAAVTGVRVRFGAVEIQTALKERAVAEEEYQEAKRSGRQAALVTRESPDVFTLAVAGILSGEDVVVTTEYVQLARPEGQGWSLRVPLTTAPRFVRENEAGSRHAAGQPLAILHDPGHRFALDLAFSDADAVSSSTHALALDQGRVRLRDGEVLPDRDCVLTWRPHLGARPTLNVWTDSNTASGATYFLALCTPPASAPAKPVPREVIVLVDHSGSMEGAKWEAANWAVERFLASLSVHDSFALGLFHDTTRWFAERPRRATPEAVREAVAFLQKHHDNGGTQLGVALEQALDRARSADTPSRHVLILTDAEVSDAGRILRLADLEAAKPDRRRVSVLCIDSAPNSAMASQLAERGGGVARFLTSNPDEDDVTTALDEVLADWSAPVLTGLTLEVNRASPQATGRMVSLLAPGPASGIDIGDLPAGRPVWVVGRTPPGDQPLTFQLRSATEIVAEQRADALRSTPGLKALFGADRIRRLEYVMDGNFAGEELRAELSRLGYELPPLTEGKVYAENTSAAAKKVVRELLIHESLSSGLPCSETAFVAVRQEAGKPVTETRIVANALPQGWSDGFAGGAVGSALPMACFAASPSDDLDGDEFELSLEDESDLSNFGPVASAGRSVVPTPPPTAAGGGMLGRVMDSLSSVFSRPGAPAPAAPMHGSPPQSVPRASSPPVQDVRISIAAGQHTTADGAVLYDPPSGAAGQFTFLSVAFADQAATADAIDPELTLLLFIGDLTVPRARVKLVDVLRQGGRRPLNLRCSAGEPVRLSLADPSGAWNSGVPAMKIVLGWRG